MKFVTLVECKLDQCGVDPIDPLPEVTYAMI
jgi:hypothetical protein